MGGVFWKDFFSASIRRLSYSFTSHVHSSHFQRGFIHHQFTSIQLNATCYSAAEATPFPLPTAPPCHPNFSRDVRWKQAYPFSVFVLLSQKTPPRSISLLVRQAFLSLSHLGSPRLCLLQAESVLFGCWWPEACAALQVEIRRERRSLAAAARCLS